MSGVSTYSSDPSVGWVSMADVLNVMTIMMRELDTKVMPEGTIVSRPAVLQHFETVRHMLGRRAVANYESFFATKAAPKKQGAQLPEDQTTKEAYDKHRAEIKAKRGV